MSRRLPAWWMAAVGLVLAAGGGCGTWVPEAGLTLPSPEYLQHSPQYIPPSPPYPLPRELAGLEAATAAQAPGRPAPALPPAGFGP
jgi:hypothetical protein